MAAPRPVQDGETMVACHLHDGGTSGTTNHGTDMNDLSNNTMSSAGAIARTERYFDSGAFKADLARRVAIPSESQNPERAAELQHYIEAEMKPGAGSHGLCLPHPHSP
jgi:hypothetical protein